jgi:2-polyprenyl-3-methyl-5-hydroxy-6-metoxy-1,4-benzoquinol methylase
MGPQADSDGDYWEQIYREQAMEAMPWYSADLDPDFERGLNAMRIETGQLLDIGTGPATQAMALARMGFTVTATDISATAVEFAREKAKQQGLDIDFQHDDILHTKLEKQFDVILDRGIFQNILPERRAEYIDTLHRLLKPSGVLFLKCFSNKEKSGTKPYRFAAEEIENYFSPRFNVLSITDTFFLTINRPPPRALFCVMKRRNGS